MRFANYAKRIPATSCSIGRFVIFARNTVAVRWFEFKVVFYTGWNQRDQVALRRISSNGPSIKRPDRRSKMKVAHRKLGPVLMTSISGTLMLVLRWLHRNPRISGRESLIARRNLSAGLITVQDNREVWFFIFDDTAIPWMGLLRQSSEQKPTISMGLIKFMSRLTLRRLLRFYHHRHLKRQGKSIKIKMTRITILGFF